MTVPQKIHSLHFPFTTFLINQLNYSHSQNQSQSCTLVSTTNAAKSLND